MTQTPAETDGTVDPAADAVRELMDYLVPPPDDLLADVGPLTQVWYLRDLAYSVMRTLAATLSIGQGDDVPDDSPPVRVLAIVSTIAGELDGAAMLVGLLPEEYASGDPAHP